jgi:hypothetical protein
MKLFDLDSDLFEKIFFSFEVTFFEKSKDSLFDFFIDLLIDLFIEAFIDLLIELSFFLENCLFSLLIDKSFECSNPVILFD